MSFGTPLTRAVVDASALIRAAVDNRFDAQDWLARIERRHVDALAPDLIWAEVSHALHRHVRAGRVVDRRAAEILLRLLGLPIVSRSLQPIAPAALAYAADRGISAYDAFYLALADAAGATLVTADRRLAAEAADAVLLA